LGLYDLKPAFRRVLSGLLPALRPVHPDVLTWAALACAVVAAVLIARSGGRGSIALLVVPLLLFLRIALNALDGLLAVATGKARAFGEVLNEATDRLADAALLLGIAYSPYSSPAIALPALAAVLFSSYVGILGKAVGAGRQYGGVLGKADRMLWIGAASLLVYFAGDLTLATPRGIRIGVFDALLHVFTLLGMLTAGQRVARIRSALRADPAGRPGASGR
jgi:CDP-diacylglycerol--glycerol-3-phosphate 3-phosphatidyltransferase